VKVGDEVEAQILTLDRDDRKMSLGIKQLTQDPWTDITAKYPVGSRHTGIVRNFTNFGVFVELEEGIDGLIYISDLSWTKKIKHPSEFVNVGDKLDVVVLELDVEGRKLSLGHKQTQANPWDKYEDSFGVGSVHNGTIAEIVDKGATVEFGDDIVAFIPTRHLEKEDGKKLKKGETADFKVIEFNKEFKRVVASHTATFRDEEEKNVRSHNDNNRDRDNNNNTRGNLRVSGQPGGPGVCESELRGSWSSQVVYHPGEPPPEGAFRGDGHRVDRCSPRLADRCWRVPQSRGPSDRTVGARN
jgi:small subunit ribosomal protein S1